MTSETERPVRIFVAMPGTSMGERSAWQDIQEIVKTLLEPMAALVGEKLGREPKLVIEKEKTAMGPIHSSMFSEAMDAEVYIADLSGANPNVYLELGVRWALQDKVTVLICQDLNDVLFNASSSRVIRYGSGWTQVETARDQIADAVVAGLKPGARVDSPVRAGADFVALPRSDVEALRKEIDDLRQQQGDDLIDAALALKDDSAGSLRMLRDAVARNPSSLRGHRELGVALRKADDLTESARVLRICVRLHHNDASAWRELGTTLSKSGAHEEARDAFGQAVALDDTDDETWSTLGGLHRRLARRDAPDRFDVEALEEALRCYQKASELSGLKPYPRLNVARVKLLIAGVHGTDPAPVFQDFENLQNLARYAVGSAKRDDPWSRFDLVDTLLLTGHEAEGLEVLRTALSLVRPDETKAVLSSVVPPLEDFLLFPDLLPAGTKSAVAEAVAEYRRHL